MNKSKLAFLTGCTGQDGSYLVEFLLDKGYNVAGLIRRNSTLRKERVDHLANIYGNDRFNLYYGDLADSSVLNKLIAELKPDEVYNLAAQSHVRISWDIPVYTCDITGLGTVRLLEAIRNNYPKAKFYQASSSEMFGAAKPPQNENTIFYPRSPYGCAKVFSYNITKNYRESFGMFTCNGILFNHESSRRGENFVTRKITINAAKIKLGLENKLYLGNLDAKRDWGFAGDYVKAMWMMLQEEKPDDYVVATGEAHSVKEFLEEVFKYHKLDWKKYVKIDERLLRPAEVDSLLGDASKITKKLGWKPEVTFKDLAIMMAQSDFELVKQGKI
jgi:GDPmannose 4,6-dehydratase